MGHCGDATSLRVEREGGLVLVHVLQITKKKNLDQLELFIHREPEHLAIFSRRSQGQCSFQTRRCEAVGTSNVPPLPALLLLSSHFSFETAIPHYVHPASPDFLGRKAVFVSIAVVTIVLAVAIALDILTIKSHALSYVYSPVPSVFCFLPCSIRCRPTTHSLFFVSRH